MSDYNPTNVRGGDVNPDQMPRWIADRKQFHRERRRQREEKHNVVPFSATLETLVRLEAQNRLTPEMKARVIGLAETYARQNKLPFDGTVRDAMRLAGQADKLVRDHVAAAAHLEKD